MPACYKFADIKVNMTAAEKINGELERLKDKSKIPYFYLNKLTDSNLQKTSQNGLPKII